MFKTYTIQAKIHSLKLSFISVFGKLIIRISLLRVKRPGREADHLYSPTAEVKNAWACISTHPYVFIAWCLIKQLGLHGVVVS